LVFRTFFKAAGQLANMAIQKRTATDPITFAGDLTMGKTAMIVDAKATVVTNKRCCFTDPAKLGDLEWGN
jgi:hypothetical protein